jgi:3-deoxy-manno-octulosonate cytidylyltransferase (CMP-KDO synthetase)
MQVEIVIPARLASTRLPEKLLLSETGQPLIAHTYQAARKSKLARGVTLAVDHLRLAQAADAIGASWVMTDPNAQSGTDRISEVARSRPDVDAFVNVQGDEPEIPGEAIDQVIGLLIAHPECSVATLATPIRKKDDLEDPACVKVVCSHRGEALYFSRSVVPHPRQWDDGLLLENPPLYLQHLGIYAYRRDFLMSLGWASYCGRNCPKCDAWDRHPSRLRCIPWPASVAGVAKNRCKRSVAKVQRRTSVFCLAVSRRRTKSHFSMAHQGRKESRESLWEGESKVTKSGMQRRI